VDFNLTTSQKPKIHLKNMSILTLLKYGQSKYNFQNRFIGISDVELTELEEEEARLAGQKLRGFLFDLAYTSMLKRAWETLYIVLKEIKQTNTPIFKNVALNERMFGNLQGLDKSETVQKYGKKQVELWQ
jgi:2,3-bisphosphoglycerate-dependent phosphoglycerate mutase